MIPIRVIHSRSCRSNQRKFMNIHHLKTKRWTNRLSIIGTMAIVTAALQFLFVRTPESRSLCLPQLKESLNDFKDTRHSSDLVSSSSSESGVRTGNASSHARISKKLSLVPGELPGYTGWARPEFTLAGFFNIDSSSENKMHLGNEWWAKLVCDHSLCRLGGSHFYVRAYGPAVISGQVVDHKDGTFFANIIALDAGTYTLEIVLTFSNTPPWEAFPLPETESEPAYEGYLLPGFPIQVTFTHDEGYQDTNADDDTDTNTDTDEFCTFDQLIENESNSALCKGRWLILDKVRHRNHVLVSENETRVSLRGYQNGLNSLGVTMDYVPKDCLLIPSSQLTPNHDMEGPNSIVQCRSPTQVGRYQHFDRLHVIFIGDSVMKLQKNMFDDFLKASKHHNNMQTTSIETNGGIVLKLDDVKSALNRIIEEGDPNEKRCILFNTGLHDLAQLCSRKWSSSRPEYLNVTDAQFSCTRMYRAAVNDLVTFIQQFPAELRVFQSTSAGWLRYGNYGFAWPSTQSQPFPLSTNFVSHFNDISFDVVKTIAPPANIFIMDAYWLSLPRPDHREVNANNDIGKHLVHPGPEVISVLQRKWLMLILEKLCNSRL